MAEDEQSGTALVVRLEDMMEFVKGGIVSRTVVETEKMEIDLFMISKGQGLSEHTSSKDAVVQVTVGEGVVTLGQMSHVAGPGSLFYIPADLPHSLEATEDMAFLLILLK